jgi:glycosyltransferase involved in cell wall biosynthesis
VTTTQAWLLLIYAGIVAIWPIRLIVLKHILGRTELLTRKSPQFQGADPPMVTAILPAKDEATNLAGCIESICRQTYPNLELIVVDDRSTDSTGEIALAQAARDSRVRVLRIEHLPAGWTGKTHALDFAARHARGSLLWFIDADTVHAPESLSVLMESARAHQAVLVSVLPQLRCESFWEQIVQPLAGITLMQSFPLHRVHDGRSSLAFANGQCILIDRDAYDAAGGHAAVRDRFVEDIALAGRVKSLGRPIRLEVARDVVTCRMYASLGQLVRGWSRIYYDALDRNAGRLFARLLDPVVFCQSGQVAFLAALVLLAGSNGTAFALVLLGLSAVHHGVMYAVFHRIYTMSVPESRYAVWFPLGNLVIDLTLLRSIRTCLTGNVSWRGTDYKPAR